MIHAARRWSIRDTGWLAWPLDRRIILSDLAMLATACAAVGLFAISPVTLEARGIAYLTSGGGVLSKAHPSTVLALVALGLRCLADDRPIATAWRLFTDDAGALLLLCAVVVTAAYAVLITKTPMTPLIDTFVLPVLMYLLLRDLDPAILRALAVLIGLVFCANAVMAIIEMLRHRHFVTIQVPAGTSSDPTRGDATFDWRAQLALDWRATALFGHPLVNGLATGSLIICFAARGTNWIPALVKVPFVALQAVAMLAFGARTAQVLTVAATGLLLAGRFVDHVRAGRRIDPRTLAIVLFCACLAIVAALAILESGLADQTIERFQNDNGSATTRLTMFNLFSPLSFSDLLLGPDPAVVATQQRIEGLEFGIESSWVGLLLAYGIVVTSILLAGLAAFIRAVLKASGPGGGLVMTFFLVLVSSAATLSTKTTTFAMTIVLILTFLQSPRSPRRGRTALHAGGA